MSGREREYLLDAFDSNWIAPLGPHVNAFEQEFGEYHGMQPGAAVASGTMALHLILRILGVGRGDTVFVSSFTFCASANPIRYLAAEPVFIDSETESWNLDPALLAEELKRAEKKGTLPKAVIAVHLYGQCANMDPILEICGEYGVPVIEDAAEALGARYKDRQAGTMGMASFFSFNGNKIITTSGGGMIIAPDPALITKARFLSTQAREEAPHYEHREIGTNYRISNLLAAIGRGQLEMLDEKVNRKREIFAYYRQRLGALPGIECMPEPEWSYSNRWLTCLTVDADAFGADREAIRLALEEENIESRPLWKPLHMQPVFKAYHCAGGAVCEGLFNTGLCLPSGTSLTEEDLERICGIIESLNTNR